MEEKGLIAAGHESAVNYTSIERFCSSAIGKRMKSAARVWRELPFSRMIPVGKVNPTYSESAEKIFIQGVIDVLFEETTAASSCSTTRPTATPPPTRFAAATPSRSSSTAKPSNPSSASPSKRASSSCSTTARACGFLESSNSQIV